uniref:Uncharacterized protein n=1 Tax=Aegilops tauschii TaxID=37682 RepID=R7W314_AEGTA
MDPIDPCLLSFLSHHGIDGAFEILSSPGDPAAEETKDAFQKVAPISLLLQHGFFFELTACVLDRVYIHVRVTGREKYVHHETIVSDFCRTPRAVDVEGMADGNTGKVLLGGEEKPSAMKREHGPAEGEQDPKKPRTAEGSCM